MRIRTNQENAFLVKLLRVYRKAIFHNKKNIIVKIMSNSFDLDSMFSGIEKNEFAILHKLAIERVLK